MTSSNESNNESSKFCTSAGTVYYCGIRTHSVYIHEYFTREYFNTTVPSNLEFKNAKNAKIANLQNTNPAKIKAHTVYRHTTTHNNTHIHINSCIYRIEGNFHRIKFL